MWNLTTPDATESVQQGFDMFVDDTDLLSIAAHTQSATVPIQIAQTNLNLWNELLQASGGELNLSKCVWFHFFWQADSSGTVCLTNLSESSPQLLLAVHQQPPVPIKRLQLSKAHRYLGVQITSDGDCTAELRLFHECNNCFVRLLHQCPFPYKDITVIYKLPMVSYPLPATFMQTTKLYKLQGPATTVFLSKMGYPRTFPQAVAYAASNRGGVGL